MSYELRQAAKPIPEHGWSDLIRRVAPSFLLKRHAKRDWDALCEHMGETMNKKLDDMIKELSEKYKGELNVLVARPVPRSHTRAIYTSCPFELDATPEGTVQSPLALAYLGFSNYLLALQEDLAEITEAILRSKSSELPLGLPVWPWPQTWKEICPSDSQSPPP